MSKRIIIDGYNLIFKFPDLKELMERDLEGARKGLIYRLAPHAEKNGLNIVIVFDGNEQSSDPWDSIPHVQVVYSTFPEKADPFIKRIIEQNTGGEDLVVVSSDNEIIEFARLCGKQVIRSETYAEQLSRAVDVADVEKKFDHPMDQEEMEEWMRLFGEARDPERDA